MTLWWLYLLTGVILGIIVAIDVLLIISCHILDEKRKGHFKDKDDWRDS